MPINELISHLRVLERQSSWRYSELPEQITDETLIQLDGLSLIEVRLWGQEDIGGRRTEAPAPKTWYGRSGWFVAGDKPWIAGTLDELLKHPDHQGEYEPEFRVSPTGADWLLRAEQESGSQLNHAFGRGQGGEAAAHEPELIPARDSGNADAHTVDDDSLLSPARLAKLFGVPAEALRQRLNRFRKKNHTGWIENTERGGHDPQYLYQVGTVQPIIKALKASSSMSSSCPPQKT